MNFKLYRKYWQQARGKSILQVVVLYTHSSREPGCVQADIQNANIVLLDLYWAMGSSRGIASLGSSYHDTEKTSLDSSQNLIVLCWSIHRRLKITHAARPSAAAPPATPHGTVFKFRTATSTPPHLQMCSCSFRSSSWRGRPATTVTHYLCCFMFL